MKGIWGFIITIVLLTGFAFPAIEGRPIASIPLDPGMWRAPGSDRTIRTDGVAQVGLGNGLVRLDWPDGRSEIRGLASEGCPVIYQRSGNNVLWRFDLQKKAELLGKSLRYEAWADGRRFTLISDESLSPSELDVFKSVIKNSPATTFKEQTFYVIREIGEVQSGDGKFYPLGGLHDSGSDSIFIKREIFSNYGKLAFILRHEVGHSWDEKMNWISQSIFDSKGQKLFGEGQLRVDPKGQIDLNHSGFSSVYASTNSGEDFAETHELLLRLREWYLHQDSIDLLSVNPEVFNQMAAGAGLSPLIQKKLFAVWQNVYHAEAMAASKPLQTVASGGTDQPSK